MKTGGFVLLALLLVGLCGAERTLENRRQGNQLKATKPFQSGHEYIFEYNAQMSSGLMVGQENVDSQQTSATRIQSEAQITFQSESQGILRLRKIQIGYLNEQIDKPEQVQPMGRFTLKNIQSEKKTQLEMPVQFKYVDGVVENVQFNQEDNVWSRNIKRAVLNLLQLNLNKNNAQGLRKQETEGSSEEEQSEGQLRYKGFTIPETTIEGECPTTYTITNVQDRKNQIDNEEQQRYQRFNVTKSIDFKQCTKVADIGFGYQTQQLQPKWWQCQQQWEQMQQQDKFNRRPLSAPCDQYDPKEINEQQLDRSTVLRFQLSGKTQKYGIQRVELLSHYVFKNLHSENSKYPSAMQTFVAAELVFVQSQQAQRQDSIRSSDKTESLLYSNEWDVLEKRFYMLGDDEFTRTSPFRSAQNKAEQAQQILRKLIQATTDKSNGIEAENTIQIQRLVEFLRMCSVEELHKIYQHLTSSVSTRTEVEQHRAEHLLADTLAIAGTRNTIYVLVTKVLENKLSSEKAVQALKNLNQLPAPSHQQADLLLRLCKSENAHRSPALKQSCWLAFGAMVSELCQQRLYTREQQTFGYLSGFETEEICPLNKKESYKQAFAKLYEEAETTTEKVVALRAIGNAGLDILVNTLEKVIREQTEEPITRIIAIDSLRRLRHQIPQKIQRILLPLYQNVQENEKVRMAAFTMIMHTVPEQNVLDQITFTLINEPSNDVKSFVYTTMQSLSESKMPNHQRLGQHLKNSLKLANFDEQTLSGSRKYQLPIFNDEHREGALIDLVSVFTDRDVFPAHLSASLHTLLNNRFEMNAVRVSISQQELDRWYEQIMRQIYNFGSESSKVRGNRKSSSNTRGTDELTRVFKGLSIKKRNGYSDNEQRKIEEFGVLNIRIGDVDQVIWPINKENMPETIRTVLNGGKPGLKQIVNAVSEPMHMRFVMALNLDKKSAMIPTTMGVALKIVQAAPVLINFEGHLKPTAESNSIKAQITANPSICITQMQRMESWMPFVNTGVESYRGLEANFATQMELIANSHEGIKLVIKTPQAPKTTIFGFHSLPTTFSRDFDNKNNMHREQKVKAIHHFHLEELQRDINEQFGEKSLGMPFRINGHYHSAADKMDYQQLMQLAMATENHVHVTFEPTNETPREFIIRLSAGSFEKIQQQENSKHGPELDNFYANAGNFETAYPEDFEDMNIESHKERSESLKSYIAKYRSAAGQMYKHQLKASAHSVGGQKEFKAEIVVDATCDSRFKYCKLNTKVERSPFYADETSQWVLKSKIQIVTPEIVNTVEELQQQSQKNKKFVCLAETNWGSNQRQSINLRIQGENAQKAQWRQEISEYTSQAQRLSEQKRMAFLNKYDVVAEYKVQPSTQNFLNGLLELVKGYNFWNTKSQQIDNGREGQFVGTIVLDPFTQRHANITVKTPTQKIRMQSVRLPIQLRPFALVTRQSEKSIHSISQAFSRLSTQSRAECKVDGRRVQTFDEVFYKAPISTCYSLLAKDCTNDEPRFAVSMKKIDNESQDKKIRVLTPENIIVCQPKESGNSKRIECEVNGETIEKSYGSNYDDIIDYTNEEQDEVTINVEGVSVQFRCEYNDCENQKAIIKISNLYKNGQCGICGHYDDDSNADNEWRMNNDETTDDLMKFHQSYTLQDDECAQKDHNEFYSSKNAEQFSVEDSFEQQQQEREQYASEKVNEWEQESSSEEEDKWGQQTYRKQQQNRNQRRNFNRDQENTEEQEEEPIMQTKVVEHANKICFSVEAVKQCPEGTVPKTSNDDSRDISGKTKLGFSCLNRSSVEARKLLQQARRGVIVDLNNKSPSFMEPVEQHQRCVRVY